MNHLRKAAEAGATLRRRVVHVNPARQVKKSLGLTGRQLRKLRKQLARQERSKARAKAAAAPPAADIVARPRRPPSPRPGPGASLERPPRLVLPHTPGAI
jgi:hypothetical protein